MKDPKNEARRWWRQALSDFAFLPTAMEAGKYDTCCFLAQQTAEKGLKAFLFHHGEELILTHSIFKLCEMAARYRSEFTALKEQVKQLDFYYIEARYPNALEDVIPAEFYSRQDAEQAIRMSQSVMDSVAGFIAASNSPEA
jgi:HEPN domain-containing protein